MGYPREIGIVDTMVGMPIPKQEFDKYANVRELTRDEESRSGFEMPAQYMFKNIPAVQASDDYGAVLVDELDRVGIERALIGVADDRPHAIKALADHPGRLHAVFNVKPNDAMKGVYALVKAYETYGIVAAAVAPALENPQVPINDKRLYPFYAKCCELGIPMFVLAGVPGPRIPLAPQKVELLDEVCWWFPELTLITRHGCMPDVDLAVQLLLKWPNLYYSTSAMAPKHYPRAIIDFANTRGADKVIYAGYFPMGLSYDRILGDMDGVAFRDEVWPKFLRENALRVLGLGDGA
ncbi:MAG: amidohydrolase family protein [Acidimicrobiia bacterium]|nr:amidohydrolase family protein [Acidimicrobiia bacterium]